MTLKGLGENLNSNQNIPEKQKGPNYLEKEFPGADKSEAYSPSFFKAPSADKKALWIKEDEEKNEKKQKIKKITLILVLSITALALLIYGVLFLRKRAFNEEKVSVTVSGLSSAKSGDLATIEIEFKNDNWVAIKNAVLYINYSENFRPNENLSLESNGPNARKFNIGTIDGKSSGKLELKGKFFGTADLLTYINAKLAYSSSNFSSTFEKEGKLGVLITAGSISVELTGPQSVYSGGAVTYVANIKNNSEETFSGLMVKADYPEGFKYSSAEPLPATGENIWFIGDLAGGQMISVKIIGTLSGPVGEIKRIMSYVGTGSGEEFNAYSQNETSTKIIGSPLLVRQQVNGKDGELLVNAGEHLNFKITYKNTGSVALRDVIISEDIKSPILDYEKFSGENSKGSLDSSTGKVTWKASQVEDLKALPPGAEGEVIFSIPVKERIDIQKVSDKNFAILALASVDSPDIPSPEGANKQVASNVVNIKLNSKLTMSLKGYFNDADIQNSGPLPLKVGEETTFTMHLDIGNVLNDITNAKVAITLAPGVKWKNNYLPKNESVNYNDRTNEIIWDVGTMPAGLGVLTDPKSLVFQIGVIPSQNDIGGAVALLKSTVFTADDAFTKSKLLLSLDEKNSELNEDISVGDGGRVIQ